MTKAMKMVAASRLKKAKNAVEAMRPYSAKIEEMISDIASNVSIRGNLSEKFPLLTGKGVDKTHLIVIISSDRGLCGGLNSSTVKLAKNRIKALADQGREVKIFCIGRKAYEQLRVVYSDKIIEKNFGIFKDVIDYKVAQEIADRLVEMFSSEVFDVCEVIYSRFKSAIAQDQVCKQIIPVPANVKQKTTEEVLVEAPISYEPSEEKILSALLLKNLAMQIYNELLENSASEQGARMAAMEAATNNAGKMIKSLTLVYNRTRQANITTELIDIISGANVAA
jgi:F-type H+-transporting ATPase subunit gamma